MKSKSDFTKDELRKIVLQLANNNGYDKPSTYLDELLQDVRQFKNFEFEQNFFLNIHYLCKENSDKFWSENHRKDISNWLRKARIFPQDVFETTWERQTETPPQRTETKPEQEIDKIDINKLKGNETILAYYQNNYYFYYLKHNKVIPLIKGAINIIDKSFIEYPWASYIDGFEEGYKKGLQIHFKDEVENYLVLIPPEPLMPELTTIPPENIPFFDVLKARNYGAYTAKCYLAWEFVINNFSTFDKYFLENITKKVDSIFSVLEWATIFHYADATKLLPKAKTLEIKIAAFIEKHKIKTTVKYFRKQYYDFDQRKGGKSYYPIKKLDKIKPFITENYQLAVTLLENDIKYFENFKPDNE